MLWDGLLLLAFCTGDIKELRERERERLHYVHSASLAYEDESVFMSGPFAEWL